MISQETDVQAAAWYNRLCDSNNSCFLPLFFDEHRYLVLKGGGGSGKSIFAGRKTLERCVSEPGHRILVCRKVAKTLRESCFDQLRGQISQFYPEAGAAVNRSELSITFRNGSKILFAGLDDVEKLKSIYGLTGIWIEEASELLESDFNQLDIRLRGETRYYKQIILSFNPISINHWLKRRFFDTKDPRALVCQSTYRDNRFLDQEAIKTLEGFRVTDRYYYQVYCLGEWGVTGKSVFDAEAVQARLNRHIRPQRTGCFTWVEREGRLTDVHFMEDRDGAARIYREPEPGAPYVIGADTAGDGSDFFVAQVIDNRTGEQVCVLRQRSDEDQFARQLYCLGIFYNSALIGVEANFSTFPIRELERLRYPKQYVRETVDSYTHRTRKSYGFRTDGKTRPVIIAGLIQAVREHPECVSDETTLEEMLTFVRTEKWTRPEAERGAHDDCVMALAIAHGIRDQQRYTLVASGDAPDRVEWSDSMWEDYRAASPEDREYLRRKWGKPE